MFFLNVTSYYQFSDELSVPGKFKAKASGTAVTLTWYKDKNANEYAIYRATTPSGTFEKLTTVTAAKCVDKNVIKGNTYYYKIRSMNGTNVSKLSEPIKAVMPKPTATPKPTKTPKPTATPRPPKYVLFVYGGAECESYQGHWRINLQVVNIDTNNAVEAFDVTFCCTNVYDEELIKRKGTKEYYVTFTFNKTIQPEDFAYAGSVLLDGFNDVKYIYAAVTKYKLKDGKTIKIPEKDRYWNKITAE